MPERYTEEPRGYRSAPGYVKSLPENNDHYLDQYRDDPWFRFVSKCHENLMTVVPGYNIRQIKAKFGGLRYYIDKGNCPDDVWEANQDAARGFVAAAEEAVSLFERGVIE